MHFALKFLFLLAFCRLSLCKPGENAVEKRQRMEEGGRKNFECLQKAQAGFVAQMVYGFGGENMMKHASEEKNKLLTFSLSQLDIAKVSVVFQKYQHRLLHQAYLLRLPIHKDGNEWYNPGKEKSNEIVDAFKNGIQLAMWRHTFSLDLATIAKEFTDAWNKELVVPAVRGAHILPSLIEKVLAKAMAGMVDWQKEAMTKRLARLTMQRFVAHRDTNVGPMPFCSLNPEYMALNERNSHVFCSLDTFNTNNEFDKKLLLETEVDLPEGVTVPKGLGRRLTLKKLFDERKKFGYKFEEIFIYCNKAMWKSDELTEMPPSVPPPETPVVETKATGQGPEAKPSMQRNRNNELKPNMVFSGKPQLNNHGERVFVGVPMYKARLHATGHEAAGNVLPTGTEVTEKASETVDDSTGSTGVESESRAGQSMRTGSISSSKATGREQLNSRGEKIFEGIKTEHKNRENAWREDMERKKVEKQAHFEAERADMLAEFEASVRNGVAAETADESRNPTAFSED